MAFVFLPWSCEGSAFKPLVALKPSGFYTMLGTNAGSGTLVYALCHPPFVKQAHSRCLLLF